MLTMASQFPLSFTFKSISSCLAIKLLFVAIVRDVSRKIRDLSQRKRVHIRSIQLVENSAIRSLVWRIANLSLDFALVEDCGVLG